MKKLPAATAILLCLAACSRESTEMPDPRPASANEVAPSASTPSASPAPSTAPAPAAAEILTLEGLGPLRIGEPVPAGSGWAERGAQVSDGCRTVSAPDRPGVHAIVEGGKVRRITVGKGSDVKLVEGIGAGATEAEVLAAFPGFRSEPHKYSDPPAKYLTAPNAESGDPALRFEIGTDGKVSFVHVGTKPVLFYVEGCA